MLTATFVPHERLSISVLGIETRYSGFYDCNVMVAEFHEDLASVQFPASVPDVRMRAIELAVRDHEIPACLLDGKYSEAATDKGDLVEAMVQTDASNGSRFLTVTFQHAFSGEGRQIVGTRIAFYAAREWLGKLLNEDVSHLRASC